MLQIKKITGKLSSLILFFALLSPLTGYADETLLAASSAVNINVASAEAIAENMHGVGLNKATAIVAWRDAHGEFQTKDQLLEVKGIGESTLENNKSLIRLE